MIKGWKSYMAFKDVLNICYGKHSCAIRVFRYPKPEADLGLLQHPRWNTL